MEKAALTLIVGLVTIVAGCTTSDGVGTDTMKNDTANMNDDTPTAHSLILAQARTVAADLDTPEKALAAGYVPLPECVPGMGVHWLHMPGSPDSYFDGTFDATKPEGLLFLPDDANLSDTSGDKFLGLEYLVVTEGSAMNTTETVPRFEGVAFNGPMEGHGPGMPWHADLHIYLADGIVSGPGFSPTSSGITCPEPEGSTPAVKDARGDEEVHARIIEKARAVAANLDTPEKAFAAGYRALPECVPGMGVHWLHMPGQEGSYFDTTFDPDFPEVVMFLPNDGNLSDTSGDTFLGLEYMVVTQGLPTNTTATVPRFDGVFFNGPMEGHAPGMPWHADLHIYLAEGLVSDASFSPTSPAIVCPSST